MAPLTPTWIQPSHPDIQELINGSDANSFTTKSISKISLPPFGLFAKLSFPPCTIAEKPTYATVQIGRDTHINLNSDMLYLNHSCEPSLIITTHPTSLATSFPNSPNINIKILILAGPSGLKPNQELTFFYPSTEWSMNQPFHCNCASPQCLGLINGAGQMGLDKLSGYWLGGWIYELFFEQQREGKKMLEEEEEEEGGGRVGTGMGKKIENRLGNQHALHGYTNGIGNGNGHGQGETNHSTTTPEKTENLNGGRRGVTSREMSGEMGGDTI